MVAKIDIFRAANLLIKQHGDQADIEAAARADKYLDEGDLEGAETWRRILKAIREMQRPARSGDPIN